MKESKKIISKRLRTNVIWLIDLFSSKDKQTEYAEKVGDSTAIQEFPCLWFDDIYHPDNDVFCDGFTTEELIELKKFNDFYDNILNSLPNEAQNIYTLLIDEEWEKLIALAKETKNKLSQ